MKYIIYLLFLIQIQNYCKSETNVKPRISLNKDEFAQENYLINSIDKIAIGGKIKDENKIIELKTTLKNTFDREVVRPYMWDIFVARNDTLLQFYNYKKIIINHMDFKSYYIKIDYEDGNYESILLVNESLDNEYNSMIVYEKLISEENHSRITQITGDRIQIMIKSPRESKKLDFQVKDGIFLDYFDNQLVDEKWGDKENFGIKKIFKYQLKGKTNNHLKNGYWIEKRYSFEYGKSIIQDGYYINGLRDGDWNYSPDGPVDVIKKFDKGGVISKSYP